MKHLNSNYLFEIQTIRAIGCLLVLLVHVSATYYYMQDGYNDLTFFFNQIGRFGTPLFAVISGFLLFYQVRKKGFDFKRFLTSRTVKIGAPFVFWSFFYLLLMFIFEGKNPLNDGKKMFTVNFLLGNSYVHLYFMSIVFQFYLLFPLLQFFRSKKSWSVLLIIALGLNLYAVQFYSSPVEMDTLGYIIDQRAFLMNWIFFFVLGGFLAYNWETIHEYAKRLKLVSVVGVIMVVFFTIYEYQTKGSVSSNRPWNFLNIPIIIFAIIGLYDYVSKSKYLTKTLNLIGQLSMGIYLVHMFVIYVFVRTVPEGVWTTINFPFVFLAILLGSIAMIKLIQFLPWNHFIITVPKTRSAKTSTHKLKEKTAS
ncbi:acyltransferase [Sutcliffiella horikoshii]|uniref:acyltransferase n=1 Tax=Sutcliffiella horikoshii TaxID=79883 RepID=UPI003CEBBAC8